MLKLIKAQIQQMSQQQMDELIPKDTVERIKRTDRKAIFHIFSVGHEGTANASELSLGQKTSKLFHYVKDTIIRLGKKIAFGTPLFYGHSNTNEHTGREQIGEVVGKTVEEVKGKISAVIAAYIYPQFRDKDLKNASIEAEVEYIPKTHKSADVVDIVNITGIALSDIEKPAFPEATILGVVQAFVGKKSLLTRIQGVREKIKRM